ncbi:MAG: hypothetical protein BMS9Abin31_0006 [Gammaproteobacteria bacterium]|nr:MAG: hypothetical protein BMS9Abin31_0006 [Gammaproteobacteria bacterium]
MVNHKIKIAVSSCLLGEAVRYDGTDNHIEYITQQLSTEYNLISLCPEMAAGMGVPRPPIQLVDCESSVQVLGVDNPENNMTKQLTEYGRKVIETHSDICGYIFKKNSPSCGTKDVKVLNKQGEYERKGQGVYAATIMKALPLLPVIDEEECLNKELMDAFLLAVALYSDVVYSKK